jgi:hypothetical protein
VLGFDGFELDSDLFAGDEVDSEVDVTCRVWKRTAGGAVGRMSSGTTSRNDQRTRRQQSVSSQRETCNWRHLVTAAHAPYQ